MRRRAENRTSPTASNYSNKEPVENQTGNTVGQTNQTLTLNQLFNIYQSAVFIVYTSDGVQDYQGTGFFISSTGVAVSNSHVFEGTSRGLEIIKTISGNEFTVESVLAQSREDDYIIFKVRLTDNFSFTPIPIATSIPVVGDDVFAIGNPYGLEHTLSRGIISGFRENNTLIQTTTEITHGSSGSPLLNMKGEVVGITTAGFGEANLNFAINIIILGLDNYL